MKYVIESTYRGDDGEIFINEFKSEYVDKLPFTLASHVAAQSTIDCAENNLFDILSMKISVIDDEEGEDDAEV